MVGCNLRVFLAEEALDLITGEDSIAEDERFASLLDESDNEFEVVKQHNLFYIANFIRNFIDNNIYTCILC